MDALEKLIIARTALVSSSPFFGTLAILFKFKEDKNLPFVAGTDGEYFYYNPKEIEKLSIKQLHFVFAHEVMHCALGHIWRVEKREKLRWNFATDFVINLILEVNGFELIGGCLLDHKFRDMSSEQVYDILPNQKSLSIKSSNGMSGTEQIPNGESESNPTKNHEKWGKGKNGKCKNGKKNKNKTEKIVNKFGKKKSPQQRMWESAMANAVTSCKERGTSPAGMERLFETLIPRENWKDILSIYMSTSTSDFDFMVRDRRSNYSDFYLPDLSSEDELENIVVAVDTSGSIDNKSLNSFIAEVKSILDSFPKTKGWLIDCDSAVASVIPIEEVTEKKSFYGGGGTSHIPVFEEIKKRDLNPKVVICFTDLYTEYPSKYPPYPVLWLATPDCSSQNPPFGRVIKMKDWQDL